MRIALLALPLLMLAAPAMAQERSKVLERVVDCRKVTDPAERLACYDQAVAALDEAEAKKDVVVVDKDQVRAARKSVFGLNLPRIKLFGGDDEATDVDEVESTIKSVTFQRDGRIFFVIEDGARWVQTDDKTVFGIKAGQKVILKKGALGSFFAKFERGPGIRVARVN